MDQTKLLIVDDDADTRDLYADVFRAAEFDVREAEDGLEGLEMVNQIVPDVIITGIIMPRMDGFQFFEALKKNVATASVPVAFLSHLGREEDERRAKEIGAEDFIVRSLVSPIEAVKRIRALVASSEFTVAIDRTAYDSASLADALGIPANYEGEDGRHFVLKLKLRNAERREFDATLVEQ
jgi:DNA-binding response OmpR family regulator